MSGIFGSRLISFVSKNNRLANPIKQPIFSSASPVKMSGIFGSRLISFISKNNRLANPIKQPVFSFASPVKMSGIFGSRLISFISKNHRLANPIKQPIISSASPFNGQLPLLQRYSTKPSDRPTQAISFSNAVNESVQPLFLVDENDLVSEASLRKLYERWMCHHNVTRNSSEKKRRFKVFKKNAKELHKDYKMKKYSKMDLNSFADWTREDLFELLGCNPSDYETLENKVVSVKGFNNSHYENSIYKPFDDNDGDMGDGKNTRGW
ncbi:hypothetical protein L1049_018893 [Liquidambar formosana]|uniref:Cathepsin propeptide inhibitor domain-containing protein n=1 Tax=Liquidambar formosana TaxID=63359 RepID=A0AAP0RAP1_LIQFO